MLDAAARATLLRAARDAIQSRLDDTLPHFHPSEAEGVLAEPHGCFVTLRRNGDLRGCIGTLSPDRGLAEEVRDMAIAAASRDPRFPPVERAEVAQLSLEISVLTPAEPIAAADVVVGTHGLIVEQGGRRGVLLPQVATDHRLDATRFVEATCEKAGLSRDAWRDERTKLYAFRAEVFGED